MIRENLIEAPTSTVLSPNARISDTDSRRQGEPRVFDSGVTNNDNGNGTDKDGNDDLNT